MWQLMKVPESLPGGSPGMVTGGLEISLSEATTAIAFRKIPGIVQGFLQPSAWYPSVGTTGKVLMNGHCQSLMVCCVQSKGWDLGNLFLGRDAAGCIFSSHSNPFFFADGIFFLVQALKALLANIHDSWDFMSLSSTTQ